MCSFRFCAWLKCSSTHLSQWGQIYFWKWPEFLCFWPFLQTVLSFSKLEQCRLNKILIFDRFLCFMNLVEQWYQLEVSKKKHEKRQIFSSLKRNCFEIDLTENRQFYPIFVIFFRKVLTPLWFCYALLCFFCCHQWRHLSGFLFGFYSPSPALPYSIMKLLSQLEIAYSGNCIWKLNSKFS